MQKSTAKPDVEPARLDRFLTYRLHAISRASDRESSAAYLRECGLGLSEGRCLATIGSFQPLSLQDLARAANQDKAQASRAAAALVERGLVIKETNADDGRGVALRLARAGRAVYQRAMALIAARNASIFQVLSSDEQALLADLLGRVAASQGVALPDAAIASAARPVVPAAGRARRVGRAVPRIATQRLVPAALPGEVG